MIVFFYLKNEISWFSVRVDELGDTSVVIFKMEATESKISTIVVRGATENYMDDIERAIDDGVNTYKGKFYTYFKVNFGDCCDSWLTFKTQKSCTSMWNCQF